MEYENTRLKTFLAANRCVYLANKKQRTNLTNYQARVLSVIYLHPSLSRRKIHERLEGFNLTNSRRSSYACMRRLLAKNFIKIETIGKIEILNYSLSGMTFVKEFKKQMKVVKFR